MAKERYADPETIGHIIDLRKRLEKAEKHRDNALDGLKILRDEIWVLRMKLIENGIEIDEERNC